MADERAADGGGSGGAQRLRAVRAAVLRAGGLIAATRTSGNQRRYDRNVLRRLAFIRAARNVGLTLDEVRAELAQLPAERTPTTADWHRISRDWRERLNEKIAAIEALRDRLDSCIGCGCLSLKACALYNPEDRLGRQAQPPGAALLPALLRRPIGGDVRANH